MCSRDCNTWRSTSMCIHDGSSIKSSVLDSHPHAFMIDAWWSQLWRVMHLRSMQHKFNFNDPHVFTFGTQWGTTITPSVSNVCTKVSLPPQDGMNLGNGWYSVLQYSFKYDSSWKHLPNPHAVMLKSMWFLETLWPHDQVTVDSALLWWF